MFWQRNKEKDRFYLFAGMGGRALRRKKKIFLAWSILAGILVSIVFAVCMWMLNTYHH